MGMRPGGNETRWGNDVGNEGSTVSTDKRCSTDILQLGMHVKECSAQE